MTSLHEERPECIEGDKEIVDASHLAVGAERQVVIREPALLSRPILNHRDDRFRRSKWDMLRRGIERGR